MAGRYERLLGKALDHRGRALTILALVLIITIGALWILPREVLPGVDQGDFTIRVLLPPGTSLEGTLDVVDRIEKTILDLPGVRDVFSSMGIGEQAVVAALEQTGLNRGEIRVRMKPKFSGAGGIRVARERIPPVSGADVTLSMGESVLNQVLGSSGAQVVIQLFGNDREALKALLARVRVEAEGVAGLTDIRSDFDEGQPEMVVTVDRGAASRYGLSAAGIADFLQDILSGNVATRLNETSGKTDIRVQVPLSERHTVDKILNQTIPVSGGAVPVREVVRIQRMKSPTEIVREGQTRVISLMADVRGRSLGQTLGMLENRLESVRLSGTERIKVAGAREEMRASYKSLILAIALALMLVYMIMASQFESLIHPLIILFSVPMALIGTVWLLLITRQSLNVISLIGGVVLVGIAVNDAIVKVDFINRARRDGMGIREAVVEAGRKRFRPIVMTSVTTLLGLLPMAVGMGEGAELQRPLALAIIGGLTTSTVLTLIFIPVIYAGIEARRGKR